MNMRETYKKIIVIRKWHYYLAVHIYVSKSLRPPPHFPYLFILAAEVLAKTVRNNKSIRGFSLGIDEVKISQYADDTTLII